MIRRWALFPAGLSLSRCLAGLGFQTALLLFVVIASVRHGVATCCEGCQDHPEGLEGIEGRLFLEEGYSGGQGVSWLEVIYEFSDQHFEFSKIHQYGD